MRLGRSVSVRGTQRTHTGWFAERSWLFDLYQKYSLRL